MKKITGKTYRAKEGISIKVQVEQMIKFWIPMILIII